MRLTDLYQTTSFRLALNFFALFALTAVMLFSFIDWQIEGFLVKRVDEWVRVEGSSKSARPIAELVQQLSASQALQSTIERPITLYTSDFRYLAGTDIPFPLDHPVAGKPFVFGHDPWLRHSPFRGMLWHLPGGDWLLVSQSIDAVREFSEALKSAMLLAGGGALFFGLLGAFLVGRGTVRKIEAVTLATQRIVRGGLTERLPNARGSGDIGRLVGVVNGMLDEIERLMQEVKGVCDNIAHDLRTPLTRMLGGLERTRRRAATVEEYQESIDTTIEELHGVLRTFSALLRISEVQDGVRRAGFVPLDLPQVLSDAVELYEPLAEEKQITLLLHVAGDDLPQVQGDASLMFEAIANLIDNAAKFTPPGGRINVAIAPRGRQVEISIQDTGPGISEQDREHVLRRFYRAEPSRHRPGNGLGLSLVAAIALLHGFELGIGPAPGCRITLTGPSPDLRPLAG